MPIHDIIMAAAGASKGPPSVSYANKYDSGTGGSSYTFSGASLGTASSSRSIVVCVSLYNTTARSISSLTVAGISASSIVNTSRTYHASIWICNVPTGATGDIVVNASGSSLGCTIGVYAVYNLASTTAVSSINAVQNTSFTSISGNLTSTQVGDIIIAQANYDLARTTTWTGVTERFDFTNVSGVNVTGGDATSASSGTRSVSAALSASANVGRLVAACWR